MAIRFDLVRSKIECLLTEDRVGVPVAYVNVNKSATLMAAQLDKKPWIRVTIKEDDAAAISIGNNPLRRFYGILYLQLFDDLGTGTKFLRTLGSKIATILTGPEGKGLTDDDVTIWIQTPAFTDFGLDETNVWYQCNLTSVLIYDMHTY